MPKKKFINSYEDQPKTRPADTPEARESQLIALAMDLAEQHLCDGTATSQEITHFLKLGSSKERTEKEILELQKDLITAKTEALRSQRRTEELFAAAIEAFKSYSPPVDEGYYDEDIQ